MKNKGVKNQLRREIMKYFAFISFAIAVLESMVDSIFDDFLCPMIYSTEEAYRIYDVPHFIYIVVSLLFYLLGAVIFYYFAKKSIDKEAKRGVKEQNLLYSAIAHDLKTPMTSVQGFAAALRDGKIKLQEQQEIFEIIYSKSKRMNELVDSLFAYSKLGTEEYHLKSQRFDIAAALREAAALNYSDFEDKEIELDIDIGDSPVYFYGDESEFRRAVGNLIINAWKHNEKHAKVLIRLNASEEEAVIMIADNGSAISEEMKKEIFHPFTTTEKHRPSEKGNGLGLAIAEKIINMMGGRLYIDDHVEGYTKAFVIGGLRL